MSERVAAVRVVPYGPEHDAAVLDLLRSVMGETAVIKRSQEFWDWKHRRNPFGPSYGICAFDDEQGKIAGLRMLMRWNFRAPGGEVVRAVRAVDTVTHPDYRRLGVFSRLTRQAVDDVTKEGVSLIFNTPNRQSLPGYLKMGWRVVFAVPIHLRIVRPLRFMFRLTPSPHPCDELPPWGNIFKPGVLTWAEFDDRYGDRWPGLAAAEAARPRTGYRTHRTEEYLRWRFGQHPHLTYGVFPFEEGTALRGFAVLKPNVRRRWVEVVIDDIFVDFAEDRMIGHLLDRMRRLVRGDYLAASFAPRSTEAKALRHDLFFRVPLRGMLFTARALHELPLDPFAPEHWDLTFGDLEMF